MANKHQKAIMKLKSQELLDQIEDVLVHTGKVKISGLGIFEIRQMKAREGYGVYEKKMIKIRAHNKLIFRASSSLRKAIQKYGN